MRAKRNSLLELYRFVFSIWIVFEHNYFIVENRWVHFKDGDLAVDFFFMLTGLFLINSINNNINKNNKIYSFIIKKVKALGSGIIFPVVQVYTLIYFIKYDMYSDFWYLTIYLWFIYAMLAGVLFYYLLYIIFKKINKISLFYLFTLIISLVLYFVFWKYKYSFIKGACSIGIGIAISYIPKINLKFKKFDFAYIIVSIVLILTIYLNYLNIDFIFKKQIIVLILFPSLIYFSSLINLSFKPFDILGELSVGMYLSQNICYIIRKLGVGFKINYQYFILIICITIIDYIVYKLLKYYKSIKYENNVVTS